MIDRRIRRLRQARRLIDAMRIFTTYEIDIDAHPKLGKWLTRAQAWLRVADEALRTK